jgi:hypothetical protein
MWITLHITTPLECPHPEQIGDGFCSDDTNIDECQFDGGDCCLPNIQFLFCGVCFCKEKSIFRETDGN